MIFHPTFLMILFIPAMIFSKKKLRLFKFLALAAPVTCLIFLALSQGEYSCKLYEVEFTWSFDDYSKLVGFAFLLVLLSANSYAISQKKYNELIFGSSYGGALFISLLAKDFISIFIGLEIMMVMSSIIIFISDNPKSFNIARKYFAAHLISSSMILIGITHIIFQNGSTEVIQLANLINDPKYSSTIIYIMFTGMVINVAAFPFSGWMVNYYKESSATGSLYLINFTTKLSVILLLKTFAAFEILQYVALITIIYAGFKAIKEDNIIALLCYLSIVSIGIMMLAIGYGSKIALIAATDYLFIHIIYKSLLSINAATMRDKLNITLCSQLSAIHSKIIFTSLIIGVALMINIPLTLSFFSKAEIAHLFSNSYFYLVILLGNIITMISIPWKEYINSTKSIKKININFYNNISIIIITLSAIFVGFLCLLFSLNLKFLAIYQNKYYLFETIKQLGMLFICFIIVYKLKISRKLQKAFNLLEEFSKIFTYLYKSWKKGSTANSSQEKWQINILEEQMANKLSKFHNQQTAIFAVFSLLVIMITTLIFFNSYV